MKRFKLMAVVMLSLTSFSAFAGNGYWKEVNKTDEVAATPYGIKKLLNDYKYRSLFRDIKERVLTDILVGEAPGALDKVTVTTSFLEWQDDTTCQPNDPRLKTQTYGYSACWAGTNGCEAMQSAILNRDPCLP